MFEICFKINGGWCNVYMYILKMQIEAIKACLQYLPGDLRHIRQTKDLIFLNYNGLQFNQIRFKLD